MRTLSFIILVWNSEKYLEKCFDSIIVQSDLHAIDWEVVIINNGSTDSSGVVCAKYSCRYSNFKLIDLKKNMGTTLTRNLGLNASNGKYICILDSDTELLEGDLNEVLRSLDENEKVGIIAPRLLLEDGAVQNSVKKFPTFHVKFIKMLAVLLGTRVPDIDFYEEFPFPEVKEVDSAISACWFFRSELLATVGLLDERIFYSPEDLDYCMRVRKAGRKIHYYPFLTVLHHTQQISHRKPLSKISLSHFLGLIYYFQKHGGWFKKPRFEY